MAPITIVALDGDQTGQELLEQALRVIDADQPRPLINETRLPRGIVLKK
jgi:isocitrate/isopropylmalate dehydrogenase